VRLLKRRGFTAASRFRALRLSRFFFKHFAHQAETSSRTRPNARRVCASRSRPVVLLRLEAGAPTGNAQPCGTDRTRAAEPGLRGPAPLQGSGAISSVKSLSEPLHPMSPRPDVLVFWYATTTASQLGKSARPRRAGTSAGCRQRFFDGNTSSLPCITSEPCWFHNVTSCGGDHLITA